MNKWHAIIFDLDDTLYPEAQYVLSGFSAVAHWVESHFGISHHQCFDELVTLFRAGVRKNTFDRWLSARSTLPQNIVPELVAVYRAHHPIISPHADACELLRSLQPQHKIGLVTDGYLDVQKNKWRALHLESYFDAVVFTDELGRDYWKPSIVPFLTVLARLGIENASSAVYVGDNPLKDFLGPRQLGMSTIWIRAPESQYGDRFPPNDSYRPDVVIGSLCELIQIATDHS